MKNFGRRKLILQRGREMTKIYHSKEIYCIHCGKPLGAVCLFQEENEPILQNAICLNCLPNTLRKWDLSNQRVIGNPDSYKFDYTQKNSIFDCDQLIDWIQENNPSLKVRIGVKVNDKDLS
jgi:hypothetical protein